jgi:SNF2 family DNA or RNA helicase
LSGNPVPNHYVDIWTQVFILDLGQRLGTSWYSFRDKYFYPLDYKRYSWTLKPDAKDEIIARIADISFFLDPSSELDLPKRTEIDHILELPSAAVKQYKQMEEELFYSLSEHRDENVLAPNATVAAVKCWQIASGFIYETTEEGRKTHQIHTTLVDHVETLVESMQGRPVLIAYNFIEDLERLRNKFPKARIVASGSSPKEIQDAEADWNSDLIEVLIVHINKFSHGLNLQYGSGCQIVFYGLTYNADVYDQLIRRFERQGAKFKEVIVHRLIVKNTVHEAIVSCVDRKLSQSSDFLNSLREYRNNLAEKKYVQQ